MRSRSNSFRIRYQLTDMCSLLNYKPRGKWYSYVTTQRDQATAMLQFAAAINTRRWYAINISIRVW